MNLPVDPWDRARLALELLAIDPSGLGGLWLRARASAVRDRFLRAVPAALAPRPVRRLTIRIGDELLFGGIDHLATLAAGRVVRTRGLIGEAPLALVLPMAERAEPGLAARLALALEAGHCLLALDEGAGPDEVLSPVLAERLALRVDLDGLAAGDCPELVLDAGRIAAARELLHAPRGGPDAGVELVRLAAALGIESMRPPLLALRAARAAAALAGRTEPGEDDLALAAALVLGPRARVLPEDAPPPDQRPEEPPPPEDRETRPEEDSGPPRDILLDAAKTTLPADLLDRLAGGAVARSGGGGSGGKRRGNRRGRPLAARPGRPDGVARIDLVATLRAAAPWQPLRRGATGRFLTITRSDIHLRRFEDRSDRLLVFTVDASGSAAAARLAEAKGAVELLLAEAYSRRDHVALIAFRGTGAELLLPATRSLVQAKRRLATLPGGGGTPLAAGLRAALALAETARGHGLSPTLALLTDGRANIALDGRADRPAAAEDATRLARVIAGKGMPALVIDMSLRPQPALAELARSLRGTYQPLPRADARKLAALIRP